MHVDSGRLTPGVLDGAAEHAFKHGACAALAIALHDKTGWPLVMITDSHNAFDGRDETLEGAPFASRSEIGHAGIGSALHWAVLAPDGRLVDVDGAHDPEDVLDEYEAEADGGEAAMGVSSRADAAEEYTEAGEPVPISLAAEFVDAVLERLDPSEPAEPSL